MKATIINETQLRPGDMLLCYSSVLRGADDALGRGYAHVALCGENGLPFEANQSGVRVTAVRDLLGVYEHIAVVRAPCTWFADRIHKLDGFLQSQVGKPFNRVGMYRVPKRKQALHNEAMERVYGYFEGTETSPSSEQIARQFQMLFNGLLGR